MNSPKWPRQNLLRLALAVAIGTLLGWLLCIVVYASGNGLWAVTSGYFFPEPTGYVATIWAVFGGLIAALVADGYRIRKL